MRDHLPGLRAAMADPRVYPHPVGELECRETHASVVFLTGDWVYKIKKPVNFGFLDYSTLEKRRACCQAEVRLNRRLSQGIYWDVVPLTCEAGGYALAGQGPAVEYAVKMVQLPDGDTMTERLRRGTLTQEEVAAVAAKLAAFYQLRATRAPIQLLGGWDGVGLNCEENFSQTEPFCGRFIDGRRHRGVHRATRRFLSARKALFDRRVAQGFIRDCHGDLRCDHVYLGAEIQILDCIEFNQRFRYGDVAADIAFLAMDLDFQRAPELARQLIAAYAEASEDFGIYALLDFYKCYRAFVRCKINCFQLDQERPGASHRSRLHAETRRYLELAWSYAINFSRPVAWIFCGLPASGKSTQARQLARSLRLPWLRSDLIRKKLAGRVPGDAGPRAFNQGIYTPEFTARTYRRMAELAQKHLTVGRSVVLDATFSRAGQRKMLRDMAAVLHVPLLWVVCEAGDGLLERRLADRERGEGLSDARLVHLEPFKARWEPLDEIAESHRLVANTEVLEEKLLGRILARGHQRFAEMRQADENINPKLVGEPPVPRPGPRAAPWHRRSPLP